MVYNVKSPPKQDPPLLPGIPPDDVFYKKEQVIEAPSETCPDRDN